MAAQERIPREVRGIQALLGVQAAIWLVSHFLVLGPWLSLRDWSRASGTPARAYAPVAGAQTRFSMLGSYSVGNPTVLDAYIWLLPVLVILLAVGVILIAGRPRPIGAYVVGFIETCFLYLALPTPLMILPLLAVILVVSAPARRFYFHGSAPTVGTQTT